MPLIRVTRSVTLIDLICFPHHFQITFSNTQLLRKQESPSRRCTSVFMVNCSHISPINLTLNVVSVRVSLINARVLRLKSCFFQNYKHIHGQWLSLFEISLRIFLYWL